MFDHVGLHVTDREASERFYRTVLSALGIDTPPVPSDAPYIEWDDFAIAASTALRPATTGVHIGFVAPSIEAVHGFWRAGVDAGFTSDGEPGPRPIYGDDYVGAFLLDPDGNSVEAALHEHVRTDGGHVDHVSVRVLDVAASTAFYDTIAPHAGFARRAQEPHLTRWRATGGGGGSITMVQDDRPLTHGLHVAFPAADHAAVDAFQAAAIANGYSSHGAPGERPEYHAGYYAAYVLDPDGHTIEVVDHGPG